MATQKAPLLAPHCDVRGARSEGSVARYATSSGATRLRRDSGAFRPVSSLAFLEIGRLIPIGGAGLVRLPFAAEQQHPSLERHAFFDGGSTT